MELLLLKYLLQKNLFQMNNLTLLFYKNVYVLYS